MQFSAGNVRFGIETQSQSNSRISQSARQYHSLNAYLVVEKPLISDMVKDPEFKLGRVTAVLRDSREFVRVEFSHQPRRSRDEAPDLTGWLLLDPASYWVIKEGKLKARYLSGATGTITLAYLYVENNQGIPIPLQTVHYVQHSWLGGERSETWVSECDFYEDANLPESEFTLSAFGFPEPPGVAWERPTPWWLYGIVAGFALVILSGILYKAVGRWRTPAAKPQTR